MFSLTQRLFKLVPLLFAPRNCEICENAITEACGLCQSCESQCQPLTSAHCQRCAEPFLVGRNQHHCLECLKNPPDFEKVTSVFEFEGPVVSLLHRLKFGKEAFQAQILGKLAQKSFEKALEDFKPDYLVPVPLSFLRNLSRGFNQSYLVARALQKGRKQKTPVLNELSRKHSRALSTQNLRERQRSLKKAFQVSDRISRQIQGKRILIIDDVLTTGATCRALSQSLLKAGAGSIQIFTIARVRKKF